MREYFKTVRFKLFFYLNLLMLTIVLINYYHSLQSIKEETYNGFVNTNQTIYDFLSDNIREYIYKDDMGSAKAMIRSIHNQNIRNIYILNSDKRLLVQQKKETTDNIDKIRMMIDTHKDGLVKIEDETFFITSFYLLDIPMAYLVITIDLETLHTTLDKKKESLTIRSSLLLLLTFIATYLVSLLITRPIEMIVNRLRDIRPHETLHIHLDKDDEFGFLARNIERSHNVLKEFNTYLEHEVDQKTSQLRSLNENLEERIAEEIKKNHEKERYMLYQSRLALMGEMISMIAHQWRQPLAAISAATNHLMIKTTLNRYDQDLYLSKLNNITEYTQHLSHTIDDFRNFYRTNKEKQTMSIEELIKSVLNITQSTLEQKDITIHTKLHYQGTIHTFTNEIRQVLLNLIKNAEDAFKENAIDDPIIRFTSTLHDKSHVMFTIEDNGGGIDERIIERIFDPYFTTKEQFDGTGLGLYMSKTIIEEHCGGRVTAENHQDGARFTIILPI